MKDKIKAIIKKCNDFFETPKYPFELIQETISEIQGLPVSDRSQFVEIYKKIGQELFEREIGVKNYNLNVFLQNIEDWKKEKKQAKKSEKISDIEEKLSLFIDCVLNIINNLRRYIILQVGKNPNYTTKIFLLCDRYSHRPFLNNVKNELESNCEILEIENFLKKLKEDKKFKENNFILLLTFSPGRKSEEEGLVLIDELSGFFKNEIEKIDISDYKGRTIVKIADLEEIKSEITYLVGTDLSNKQLSPDKEKIIKKLFKGEMCHTIEYSHINEGFSGSYIYEVQPFKQSGGGTKYVIKINNISNDKLKNESKNFRKHVKSYDNRYHIEEEITEKLRAIKYEYASSDGYTASTALAKKLEQRGDWLALVKNLFEITLFKKWDYSKEQVNDIPNNYYEKYINIEKIIQEICSIENSSELEVEKERLIVNLKKILFAKVSLYLKICHGDLHTQNIYIDENNNIFLIDFGDTSKHHAIIDQVTLECSIKFRHIPKYIPIEELEKIEKSFLEIESFNPNFDLNFIKRNDLKSYFQLINNIRVLAEQYICNNTSKIDYFISLFIITFRQIRYKSLNQLYALNSAKILSDKIIQELKL